MKIVLVLVGVVFAFLVWFDLDAVRVGRADSGLFFRTQVVRRVLPVAPFDDRFGVSDISEEFATAYAREEIRVRFLGLVPVNCLVSRRLQPEDPCRIYRREFGRRLDPEVRRSLIIYICF